MSTDGTTFDLEIDQGATYEQIFTWIADATPGVAGAAPEPIDLTGYTASMQIRPYALSSTLYYDAGPDITLGNAAGTVTLKIPATATEGFTWWNGVYDLLLTDSSGNVTRFLSGSVTVSPGVTT